MKYVNCSIDGKASDVPYLVIDNTHRYDGVFENPQRVRFPIGDGEPAWGATIYADGKSYRVLVPPNPGGNVEGPLLKYGPALARLQPDGNQFRVEGRPWTWAMMTGFCDYQRFLNGEDIAPQLQQAKDLGANGRRVFGMMSFITGFNPATYGDTYYARLPEFADLLARFGQRLEFCVFADAQVVMPARDQQQAHFARTCDQLRPIESVVIDLGNEYQKNGFNPGDFPYPGVLSSQGSSTSDSAPPMPGWGIRMWHGRRDDKVFLSADDMWYVGMGKDEGKGQYAPVAPVVHEEPMGFAEIDQPGRRSTDPRLAQSLMLTGRGYGAGAVFHSEDGIYSRVLGPQQQVCARAFFDVQG